MNQPTTDGLENKINFKITTMAIRPRENTKNNENLQVDAAAQKDNEGIRDFNFTEAQDSIYKDGKLYMSNGDVKVFSEKQKKLFEEFRKRMGHRKLPNKKEVDVNEK